MLNRQENTPGLGSMDRIESLPHSLPRGLSEGTFEGGV